MLYQEIDHHVENTLYQEAIVSDDNFSEYNSAENYEGCFKNWASQQS